MSQLAFFILGMIAAVVAKRLADYTVAKLTPKDTNFEGVHRGHPSESAKR